MNKALRAHTAPAASGRDARRLISTTLWVSGPLFISGCLMAASFGHMSWWPGVALTAVYALSLLRVRPKAQGAEPRDTEFEINDAGVTSHDEAGVTHLPWSEVTQVDLVSADAELAGEPLFFVIVGRDRKLVMPGSQAVLGRLVNAMTMQLGLLDEAKFLRALSSPGEARFTIWQR